MKVLNAEKRMRILMIGHFFTTDSISNKFLIIKNAYLKNFYLILRETILKSCVIKDSQKRQKKLIYCLSSSSIRIDKKY